MPPGLDNPLGARALYIFQNGEDTLYRVHGSPEYKSIGQAVSSGCVRLINQDICDLYDRVPTRTPILRGLRRLGIRTPSSAIRGCPAPEARPSDVAADRATDLITASVTVWRW